MISWTADSYENHNIKPSLNFRFDVAMSGVLGIGNNIVKWSTEEKELAKKKIAEYKQIRDIVHNGDLYRLVSPFEAERSILQYNSKDKNEAVIFCYEMDSRLRGSSVYPHRKEFFRLMGLDTDKKYNVEGQKEIYTGDQLMKVGLRYPLWQASTSSIFKLKAIQ